MRFMKECFARLPKRMVHIELIVLFFMEVCLKGEYLIKVKLKGRLQSKKWRKIRNRPGFESTEFEFKCRGWKKARRFVAIREVAKLKESSFLI